MRSVSPIHIEYLKNMGVQASMSISLIQKQSLWGLIACHHYSSKYISYEVRTACEFLGQVMSLEIASKEENQDLDYKQSLKKIQAKLLENLYQTEDWVEGLATGSKNLLNLVGAQGVILCAEQ